MIENIGQRGNFAVQERLKRMRSIIGLLNSIKNKEEIISYSKLRGNLGIKYGLSSRKINEYLDQLSDAGIIDINEKEDIITFKGD